MMDCVYVVDAAARRSRRYDRKYHGALRPVTQLVISAGVNGDDGRQQSALTAASPFIITTGMPRTVRAGLEAFRF